MTTSQKTEFYGNFLNPAIESLIGFDTKVDERLKKQEQAIANAISSNAYNTADVEAIVLLTFLVNFKYSGKDESRFNLWKNELVAALNYFIKG